MSDVFDDMAADLADEFRKLGQEMVADAQQRLSTPAGRKAGPRGGSVIIHSKRGENPRKISGALQQDIAFDVEQNGLEVSLTVYSTKSYAPILQSKLDRPVLSDTDAEFSDQIADRAAAAISGT